MTLAEFLLARIAEDEIHAGVMLAGRRDMHWQWSTHGYSGPPTVELAGTGQARPPLVAQVQLDHAHEHIARWSPARVLAECEAKRRLIDFALGSESWEGPSWPPPERFAADHARNHGHPVVLSLLALPYADHEDYRDEWKPSSRRAFRRLIG